MSNKIEKDSWEELFQEAQDARIAVEILYEETKRKSVVPPEPVPLLPPPGRGSSAPPLPA